jgi:hypothetical protein
MMEVAGTSETWVNFNETALCNVPKTVIFKVTVEDDSLLGYTVL